jgi:hypothetical protein
MWRKPWWQDMLLIYFSSAEERKRKRERERVRTGVRAMIE